MAGALIGLTLAAAAPAGTDVWARVWRTEADADAATAAAIRKRNQRAGAALAAIAPGLVARRRDRMDADALDIVADGAPSPEAAVLRLARWREWTGPAAPFEMLTVTIYDDLATLSATLPDVSPAGRAAAAALLDRVAAALGEATGLAPWDERAAAPVEGSPGAFALGQAGPTLDRWAREARRARFNVAAGPYAAAALTLAAATAIGLTLALAMAEGRAVLLSRSAPPLSFVTEAAPAATGFPFPRYTLRGTVEGAPVTLTADRAAHIRAAPGARFTVVATGDPAEPNLLRRSGGPLVPLGGDRAIPVGALVILPVILFIWGLAVAAPLLVRPRPGAMAAISRAAWLALRVGAVAGAILALRLVL